MSETDTEVLISLIFTARRRLREQLKTAKKTSTLSTEQVEALRYVHEHKTPLMKDVAAYLCITPPSASALIETLVQHGYLKRLDDTTDRRAKHLAITAKGHKELTRLFEAVRTRMRRVLKELSPTDRTHLIDILTKLS